MMKRLPILAVVLGVLGLIPFLGCTIGIILFPSDVPVPNMVMAIIAYGAVILSFLGGVHWGLALEPAPSVIVPGQAATDSKRLALGVVPSLIGWAALLVPLVLPPEAGLALLAVGFLGTIVMEARLTRAGMAPASAPNCLQKPIIERN